MSKLNKSLMMVAAGLIGAGSARAAESVHFKTVTVEDSLLQQPAFQVLVPAGWKAQGQVHWRLHPALPATGSFSAVGPNGVDAVRFYPNIPFVDGLREAAARTAQIAGPEAVQFALNSFPEGSKYIGNEVRRHVGRPEDYLTRILLPRFRPELRDYRIIATENMPAWAKASAESAAGVEMTAQAARVRLAYSEAGRALHEDFFILLPSARMMGVVYWGAESASSVRGEAGKLDPLLKMHQAMQHSIKVDLDWFNRERQVAAMLQDAFYRQQQQTMELSRYLSRTSNQISDSISKTYWNRQATLERTNARFSEALRGVESYNSPHERYPVQLPAGYRHNWVNALGEYVQSNDPSYNPNQDRSGNWSRMTPVK